MNPLIMLGNFGRRGIQIHGCVDTGSQITILPGPRVRKDAQIQLMWFGQCSSGKGNKMVSWTEPFGQMQCNTVVTSAALCVTESMYYTPALLCPISASGDPLF